MPRMLSHEDLNERGFRKSKTQRWRDVRDGLFPGPTPTGLTNSWAEDLIEYFSELIAAGFDRRTATAMVEKRRSEARARLTGNANDTRQSA
jgi:hypothetical protein